LGNSFSTGRIRAAAVIPVLAVSLALAADATACTCAPVDLVRDLPRADAAFAGTLLERREPPPAPIQSSGDPVVLVFRVEQVYKGDLSGRVEVVTARDGASCGVSTAVGERIGLLLDRQDGAWRSSLCAQVDPSDLLALTDVEDNTLPTINWGGYVIGFLVLGIAAVLLVRRRRRYSGLR
jgi:hypothetical protein